MTDSRFIGLARAPIYGEVREFLQLAWPLIGTQFSQSTIGLVDTMMMGQMGLEILAAGGLASLTFSVFLYAAMGMLMGANPLVAAAYGAGDSLSERLGQRRQIDRIARQGCWLTSAISIPLSLLISNLDVLMRQLGQAETTIDLASSYLDIMAWGFFPALGFALLRGVISAMFDSRIILAIAGLGTIINVLGNYLLGFGKFGFPHLGISGLAIASVGSIWLMFLALIIYILTDRELKQYRFLHRLDRLLLTLPDRQILIDLIRLGLPIAASTALEIGLFTCVTYLMGALGTQWLAAHQIVLQTTGFTYLVPLAMSQAATIRVGRAVGRANLTAAAQAGYVSAATGLVTMLIISACLLLFPDRIIGLFININDPQNTQVLNLAIGMMTIAAISQIVDGPQRIIVGALYGLQDTRVPMFLSLVTLWGIGLTSGYYLGLHTSLAGNGLWLGSSIGIAISAVVYLWRFQYLIKCRSGQRGKL